MSVVHIHFRYDLVESDMTELKLRIADDVADSVARHLAHDDRGALRDLVTVVFHDLDPEYSVVQYLDDEVGDSVKTSPLGVEKLKRGGKRILRLADRPAGAVGGASRAISDKARITAQQLRITDLRFRVNPVELTQAVAVTAQANRRSDLRSGCVQAHQDGMGSGGGWSRTATPGFVSA